MRQIDAVRHERGWVLAWIVDDVLWACWSDDETAWVQSLSDNSVATIWSTCDAAETYLATHRASMRHTHFVVRGTPTITANSNCDYGLEDLAGMPESSAIRELETCLS